MKRIWTIGHSTHPIETFIEMLNAFSIGMVADVRHYPGSRRYPQFNQENLKISLEEAGIKYSHLIDLGGRRRPAKDSKNTAWKNEAFRGYADHMQTPVFKQAVKQLEELALKQNTAYMCSEAVWWSCHRSLISDHLKNAGWEVLHIMNAKKADPHRFTSPARIIDGELRYDEPSLF
jgi:uncharacterized protein (DUF488 family)